MTECGWPGRPVENYRILGIDSMLADDLSTLGSITLCCVELARYHELRSVVDALRAWSSARRQRMAIPTEKMLTRRIAFIIHAPSAKR